MIHGWELNEPAAFESVVPLRLQPMAKSHCRKNEAFSRQGEWFFVSVRDSVLVDERLVLKNEPISRGLGSKPHVCEEVVRQGGTLVYISYQYPSGLTETQRARVA